MRKILITLALLAGMATATAQSLVYNTRRADIPTIEKGSALDDYESTVRAGLPHFAAKLAEGDPVTVALLGGSITNGNFCYRLQLSKYLEDTYPGTKFRWINAGVGGTGADLGACRLDEHVLRYDPDLVFIEFSVNGAYTPGMEGIIRKIQRHNPETDICLLYSARESQVADYQHDAFPADVVEEERLAEHYALPSIHMAAKVAKLVADGSVVWRGDPDDADPDVTVFSADGLHPATAGGNFYAAAVARGLDKCLSATDLPARPLLPQPLYGTQWDGAATLSNTDIRLGDGWQMIDAAADPALKKYAKWWGTVLTTDTPGAELSFNIEGDMFGIFDLAGPDSGELEVYIEGKHHSTLARHDARSKNRYHAAYTMVKLPSAGHHTITLRNAAGTNTHHTIGRLLVRR